jgi:hypothetical protein
VNPGTVNLIERPYQDIVDDLLTAIVGGVVNEPILFDVKSNGYALAEPASDVRGITGTFQGLAHNFQKEIDFLFSEGDNSVVWQDHGNKPDDDTTFYADYFRRNSRSPLTDINVGSVTRTLAEAIGREIATVYQQINLAYLSSFIDTATGKSLDLVVSILGITRKTKEFAVGLATFFRDPAVAGNITIPQATSLATSTGDVTFQTTEPRTLQRGQARIDAPIRADDAFKGDKGKVGAGKITLMAQIVAGISSVSNFEPTILATEDESDDDLRLRAKAALRGLGKATIAALTQVIFQNRARLDEISDPNTISGKASSPGTVLMLVETEPARFPSLQAAVDETRAAGVLTTLVARFVFVEPRLVAKITPGLTGAGKDKIKSDILDALGAYVDALASGAPATGAALLAAIRKVGDVLDARIVDVRVLKSDVGNENVDPLVEALVLAVQAVNAQDTEALRVAVKTVVAGEAPALLPSGRRISDRSLLVGLSDDGQPTGPATDGQIEAGKFQIVPPAQFSVTLDMNPADILLQES